MANEPEGCPRVPEPMLGLRTGISVTAATSEIGYGGYGGSRTGPTFPVGTNEKTGVLLNFFVVVVLQKNIS
jgi:hypothetical protein